jgi:hypothetical protein
LASEATRILDIYTRALGRQLFSFASREMSFGQPFFERVARAMEPGEPASDGSEYDEEEDHPCLHGAVDLDYAPIWYDLALRLPGSKGVGTDCLTPIQNIDTEGERVV